MTSAKIRDNALVEYQMDGDKHKKPQKCTRVVNSEDNDERENRG